MPASLTFTLGEVSQVLNPPLSEDQLREIVHALRWKPDGTRHTGRSGRPVHTYSAEKLLKLHAVLVSFIEVSG